MNEHTRRDGKHYSQGGAGGAYQSREDRDASISRGLNNIVGYFRILFGKPRTTGQKIIKVLTWIFTVIMLAIIIGIIVTSR
jgi:hypothetical protein